MNDQAKALLAAFASALAACLVSFFHLTPEQSHNLELLIMAGGGLVTFVYATTHNANIRAGNSPAAPAAPPAPDLTEDRIAQIADARADARIVNYIASAHKRQREAAAAQVALSSLSGSTASPAQPKGQAP